MWLRLLILIIVTGIGCSAPTSKPAPTVSPAPPPPPWYISYGFKSYEEVIQPLSVGTLVLALSDRSNKVRASAAEALGKIGPEAKGAVPALIRSLGDDTIVQICERRGRERRGQSLNYSITRR